MMQCKVPQDVLRPDKIVGFLTLRQLIIVCIGGGIAYSLYIILSKQYFIEIWLPPVFFISLVTLAFAFIRFHDIPFEKLIFVFIEYKFKPQAQTWQKTQGDFILSVLSQPLQKSGKTVTVSAPMGAAERKKKLEEIQKIVDTHGHEMTKLQKK